MKNTESSSIVIQWGEVDDSLPTTYTVTWTSERDHMMDSNNVEEQSSYTITGLTLDTVYTITVTAFNKCGTGPEYRTSVSLTTDTTSRISTSTAITKSSAATITASIAISTTTITETTNLKTSSTNPSAVITSTYTATDIMSPVSTMNPSNATTDDENSKILSINICN